jgi:hypothetical protein
VTARHLRRGLAGGTVALVLLATQALASPAFAATHPDDGSDSGPGLSVLQTILIFVGIPAGMFIVITLLVTAPSIARGPRYRPGLGWWAAPVWFNGPDDADSAVRSASATAGGGGASARW